MKDLVAFFMILVVPVAYADQGPTYWETLGKISPGISQNFACVFGKAGEAFQTLCSADGVQVTDNFKGFLYLQGEHEAARAVADAWLKANQGRSQFPPKIQTRLENTEDALRSADRHGHITENIEKVRRQSATCK